MFRLIRQVFLVMAVALAFDSFFASTANAQFQYPPYGSVRGRMVHRSGLFHHSTRYRWGNGLTPYGAGVLTTGIQTFGPMIPTFITGMPPVDTNPAPAPGTGNDQPITELPEERSLRNAGIDWREEYAKELKLARETAERLEKLLEMYDAKEPTPAGETPSPANPQIQPLQTESTPDITDPNRNAGQIQAP